LLICKSDLALYRRFAWLSASAIRDKLEQTNTEKFPAMYVLTKEIRAATQGIHVKPQDH